MGFHFVFNGVVEVLPVDLVLSDAEHLVVRVMNKGIIASQHRVLQGLTMVLCFASPSPIRTMQQITTERFNLTDCRSLTIDTYSSGGIRFVDTDGDVLEVYGVSLDRINSEIRSYVRGQGYSYDMESLQRSSGFLSELQDEIAAALSRVQREIAEKEEKATA